MKLCFMKQEAVDLLKNNMQQIYENYYKEESNKWILDFCGENPFVEFKEIKDFDLSSLDSGMSLGEIEFNNCKIIYENMKFLDESQASSELLWAGLCHSVFYSYLRKRWGYDKTFPKTEKESTSSILSRFFVPNSSRSSLYRNSISKCWWVGHNTYDDTTNNKFEKLDLLGSLDISTKINDIFYSYKFSSNKAVLNGILKGISYFSEQGYKINIRTHIRPALQQLNAVGGVLLLDSLYEEDISHIIKDEIYSIIKENKDKNNNIEKEENDSSSVDESYKKNKKAVNLGNIVYIQNIETKEKKKIIADYVGGKRKTIPDLVKKLLYKSEGESVYWETKCYKIIEIE